MSRARCGRPNPLLAFLLVAGCYSSGTETGDGRDDAGGDDAAADTGPDAACTTPEHWRLEQQEIVRFEELDPAPHEVGRVTRVVAYVETSGAECGEVAGYQVAVDAVSLLATVTISVWWMEDALAGPCAPAAEPTRVVVRLPGLGAGTWTVMDGSAGPAGDPVTMTVEVAACDALCSCPVPYEGRPQGADCTLDCQCQEGFSCIGFWGIGGTPLWTCQRSCSDDRDCLAQERCMDWDDGPSRVCELMPTGCAPGSACPVGETCSCEPLGCFCSVAVAVEGAACCRNEDCPAGNVCIGGAGGAGCGVPCRHDFNCLGALDLPVMFCGAPPDQPGFCLEWAE
jgi:hypothetical protein